MADPNWRTSPPSSDSGFKGGPPLARQQYGGVAKNGLGASLSSGTNGAGPQGKQGLYYGAGSAPHAPSSQPMKAVPPSRSPSPMSASSARSGGPPVATTGMGPPQRGQSPFPNVGIGAGPARMSSPPLSYGSGPPSFGSGNGADAPSAVSLPRSAGSPPLSVGSGMQMGAPPSRVGSGPPSMPSGFGIAPLAKPPISSGISSSPPPRGPPLSWSGNTAAGAYVTGAPNGQTYGAPPSFPPPQAPPGSGNGVVRNGGVGMRRAVGPGSAPSSMSMYGGQPPAPAMGGPGQGQYVAGYSNGGTRAPAFSPRPKIDPEQIPRPVVDSEGTTYRTCTPPSVRPPPPPSSKYTAIDEGNCSPRFMRSTTAQLPATADAMAACKIPLAVVIQPMALVGPEETSVPVVDFGEGGPLRCESCRAYINSYAKYVRNGEKWVCNFCKHEGDVPQNYQCPLDAAGLRRDREQRPELCRGSVDFVVPKAVYCLRPEQQPIFVFCVDASPRALETGFTVACLSAIEAAVEVIPGGDRARVGLMTFDNSLHVYRFDEEGNVSQMVVAADTEEPYAPLPPAQWVLPLHSSKTGLPGLLQAIPGLVEGGRQTSPASACASGAALRATADCLEGIGGRVFLMAQSPADTGAGAVHRGREEASLYGGEKEFRLYQPAEESGKDAASVATGVFYKALAKDCASRQVCVDLMLWSGERVREFQDAATLGMVSRVTGGRVTYMRGLDAGSAETVEHLREQLSGALSDHAHSANEAILKVRCTAGMVCSQRLGPGVENMPGELEVANISPHHAVVCRLEHDGQKLQEGSLIFVQAALLYTSSSGERRVRCHTLGLPATGVLTNIFGSVDVETVCTVMARQAVSRALHNKLAVQAILTQVEDAMRAMLFSYRKRCAPNSPAGQLILPETLRVLPLFTLCIHKMLALRPNSKGGAPDVRADERAARLLAAHSMSITDMVQALYPSLYSMHDLPPDVGDVPPPFPPGSADASEGQEGLLAAAAGRGVEGIWGRPRPRVEVPVALPPTSENLRSDGVFLLDSGEELLLYVGRSVSGDVLQELFGVDSLDGPGRSDYGSRGTTLRVREDEGFEQARRLRNVIAHLRRGGATFKPLVVVVANSGASEESRFVSLMVEDKTKQGTSYVDELCHLHHKIQSKMG